MVSKSLLKNAFCLLGVFCLISCASVKSAPSVEAGPCCGKEPAEKIVPDSTQKNPEPIEPEPAKMKSDSIIADNSLEKSDSSVSIPATDSAEAPEASVDIYVEIPRLAEAALAKADSFFAAGIKDSALAIAEKFSVLNPLWESWQDRSRKIQDNARQETSRRNDSLRKLRVELANANARRADYAEICAIADSILNVALPADDSLRASVESLKRAAYIRTFEKVRHKRDEALQLGRERAAFDSAEIQMTDLLMRFPDFADTLRLKEALAEIGAMRSEESMLPEGYWKTHDPKEVLAKARKLRSAKKWSEAKKFLVDLKSSELRGEASAEADSVDAEFCTEKRKLAANFFAKSRKSERERWLRSAIGELNRCLEFAPGYRERETVLSNRKFLESEIGQ